ncbi:MAG: pitrilysin family protein [Cyanobacteria bacterium J06629_18]
MGNFLRRLFALLLALVFCWEFLPGATFAQTNNKAPTSQSNQFSIQPYLDRVVENLTEFKLDNGMKFIVLRRPQAPVVSFLTYADVGGVDEPDGKTGIAHFLEHLAFKGTDRIGTKNYAKEKRLLERLDKLAEQVKQAQAAGEKDKVAQLEAEFKKIEEEAHNTVKQNELGRIVEQAGGVGLNATTSAEATKYFYSFPANKLELWMSLESERFLNPELRREFYKEKDVILEERRLRVDNSPIGQMIEKFNDTAFEKHPYKRPVIGYEKDIRNLTTEDLQQFFKTHYVPSNLTVAVVGDVQAAEVKKLAAIYFGRYEARPEAEQKLAVEPKQSQEKGFTLNLPSQPWYLEGYHRPSLNHPDNAVYDIIGSLLSDGRTSRLYKSLVEEKQLALAAQGFSGFPGDKYPNLMLFYALTSPGRSVDEVAAALRQQIEALKTKPVSRKELERVKTNARAGLLRSLDSNMGMAQQLLEYEVKTGSWKNLFAQLEKIEAVTTQDVMRVAKETFVSENRTVGKLLPKKPGN